MTNFNTPNPIDLATMLKVVRHKVDAQIKRHWLKVAVLLVFFYVLNRKDLTISMSLNGMQPAADVAFDENEESEVTSEAKPVNISMLGRTEKPVKVKKSVKSTKSTADDDNLGNTYSNLTYTKSGFATKETNSDWAAKRMKQETYVKRFVKVAQTEMDKFGIPASIILAQGLLESNAGDSRLSVNNNNHFGIKCFSRSCRKGHCSNFTDDSHKDFFRKYGNAWESYRAHSQLLRANRYLHLYKLGKSDYQSWAMGLKRAGYATDKLYGEKLINLIDELNLYQYDK